MTVHGIQLLLANCDRLTRLTDLSCFEGIAPEEIKKLKIQIKEMNLNICFDDNIEDESNKILSNDDNFMNFLACANDKFRLNQ